VREWHDLDNDGQLDETGNEQHCITPGSYQVTIGSDGLVGNETKTL